MRALKINVVCSCGRTYKVPASHEGRKLQCKTCGHVTRIQSVEAKPQPISIGMLSVDDVGLDEDLKSDLGELRGAMVEEQKEIARKTRSFGVLRPESSDIMPVAHSIGVDHGGHKKIMRPADVEPTLRLVDDEPPAEVKPTPKKKKKKKKKSKRKPKAEVKPEPQPELKIVGDSSALTLADNDKDCPSCRASVSNDAQICMSCGFDFRSGKKVRTKTKRVSPKQRESLHEANLYLGRLEKLGWVSLSPFGILTGPYVLLASLTAENYTGGLRPKALGAFKSSLVQVRMVALVATVLWGGVAFYGYKRSQQKPVRRGPRVGLQNPGDNSSLEREKERLRDLANGVRRFVRRRGRFPSRDGLTASLALAELRESGLLKGGLHGTELTNKYAGRFDKSVFKGTPETRWLFWLRQGGAAGRLVVTLGGVVESYDEGDFSTALKRAFQPGGKQPAGFKAKSQEEAAKALVAFAKKPPKEVTVAGVREAIGANTVEFLAEAVQSPAEDVRSAALTVLLLVSDMNPEDRRRLAARCEQDDVGALRVRVIEIYRELENPRWLLLAARFYGSSGFEEELRQQVLSPVLETAKRDDKGLRQVLEAAAKERKKKGDPVLFPIPKELFPKLKLFLYDKGLKEEALAILQSDEEAALPVLEEMMKSTDAQERFRGLEILYEFPVLRNEEAILKLLSERLQEKSESLRFRRKALEGLTRFGSPKAIQLAIEQYSFAPSQLSPIILKIFRRSVENEYFLDELVLGLESQASGLILQVFRRRVTRRLVQVISEQAAKLKSRRAQLAVLDLIKKRIGKPVWGILKVFQKSDDSSVQEALRNHYKGMPQNPLDEDQSEVVIDFCERALRQRSRAERLQETACELLGVYQSAQTLRLLEKFIERGKISPRVRSFAIIAMGRYPTVKAVNTLVDLEKSRKVSAQDRNLIGTQLRKLTQGNGSPDWTTWVRKNRSKVDTNLDRLQKERKRELERLLLQARKYEEALIRRG